MNQIHEQLALMSTQFHWLRPWWLLALIPILILGVFLWKQKHQAYQWQQMIAPELLPFLIDGKTTGPKKSLLWALLFAWIFACLALAGPSWIKRPTPIEKNQNALVILLDLSNSMVTEDIKPSRLVRARLKITDILRERKDGQTALVAYAGEAHTVTPLSDDSATMINLLPSLSPNMMPQQGSNTEDAVARGIQLLNDAGAIRGDILLVTDGVVPEAFATIRELLANKNIHLNILGVGTTQPAPIPAGNGGFLRDSQGAIVTAQLNSNELEQLAQSVNGRYKEITNNSSDIDALMPSEQTDETGKSKLERDVDQWTDQGHWLVFLLLPIALFSFRRGFILMLICAPLMMVTPQSAYAFGWDDMWLTKDQQAAKNLGKGDAKTAATQFKTPDWKAAAQYRAGDYAAAAESYAQSDSAAAHYNRGNALAKAGKLEDAIKAYDEALKRDSTLADAQKNRELVEKMLQQQKDQNKDSNKDKQDSKDKDQKNQDQKDKDKQDQNKDQQKNDQDQKNDQNKDDKNQDKKDSDSKSSDQNSKDQQDQKNQDKKDQSQQNSSSGNNASVESQQHGQSSSAGSQQNQGQQQSSAQSSVAASSMNQGQQSSAAASNKSDANAQAAAEKNAMSEEQQAYEQWLRRVPDDPGGLLRNKFKYQYQLNRQKKAQGDYQSPDNNADKRL